MPNEDITRPDFGQPDKGLVFNSREGAKKTLSVEESRVTSNLSKEQLEQLLKERANEAASNVETGGSRVASTVSEADMIKSTAVQPVDAQILSPDAGLNAEALKQKLENFLGDPHKTMEDLINKS